MAMRTTSRSRKNRRKGRESGQAAVFLVLAMGIFLIGGIGFVVDGANLWFHRQSAQTAADAACTAGAMDLLSTAAGASLPNGSDWIGNLFLCSGTTGSGSNRTSNSTFPPCQYAGFNGYSGSGLQGIQVSFPASGTISAATTCPISTPYSSSSPAVCAADVISTPYMQLQVTDSVPTTFIRLLGAGAISTVPAKSTCGLSNVLSTVPILVLNPNAPNSGAANTMTAGSGSSLTVFGGSQKSIQVNSSDPAAVDLSSATVDLSQANGGNGGNFALVTRESQSDANGSNVSFGTGNAGWINAAGITSDPFALVDAPSKPTPDCTSGCVSHPAPNTVTDCPANASCDIYTPGYYPAVVTCPSTGTVVAICVSRNGPASGLAVFEPGVYYLDGDFIADNHSCMRPGSGAAGDIQGTLFYLHGSSTITINSQSGRLRQPPGQGTIFSCASPTYGVQLSSLTCISNAPPGVTTLTGNVLLAPCTGPYGDPLGAGLERGMLFFHDRDTQPTTQPSWTSAVSFGLVGSLYFHYCNSTTAGSGVNCDSAAFTETLTLGSGANAYIIGNIVADQLHLAGGSAITVGLSPNREYYTLKASLLQ